MAEIDIPQTTQKEGQISARSCELVKAANQTIEIVSEDQLQKAIDLVKLIKQNYKAAEDERKAIVKPFNGGVKAINQRFKEITEPLAHAEKKVKEAITKFQSELEAQRRKEAEERQRKIEEEALKKASEAEAEGNVIAAEMAIDKASRTKVKPQDFRGSQGSLTGAKSSITRRWTFEVEDVRSVCVARPDLLQINSAKVREEIRDGAREIPGLRIYQEESVSVR